MVSAAEQLASNLNFGALAKAEDLKRRIWFTLGALLVYRLGTFIPLPGINPLAFAENFNDPALLTETFLDAARLRAFMRDTAGSFAGAVARGIPGVVRGQLRHRFGKDPKHPVAPSGDSPA